MSHLNTSWPWWTLVLLGTYHGLNPAMGWLFAVALGLQERSRSAVLRAFVPIALGHAAAVAAIVALVGVAQAFIAPDLLQLIGAIGLLSFGVFKLLVNAHPRWVGMRVGFRDLTVWSFLMSTAHGAGLMLLPVLLQIAPNVAAQAAPMAHMSHAEHMNMARAGGVNDASLAVGVHTAAMFLVMAIIAMIVYEKVGLAILRRAWFNLDRIWAGALIGAGILALMMA
jgi:hypothetical protein